MTRQSVINVLSHCPLRGARVLTHCLAGTWLKIGISEQIVAQKDSAGPAPARLPRTHARHIPADVLACS
jgi:hypothetical protein